MSQLQQTGPSRLPKVALIFGYLGLIMALVSIYFNRTTGYEVSIYTATIPIFWGGVAVAIVAAVAGAMIAYDRLVGTVSLALLVLAMMSVFALPSLRGYYFHGHGDALVHLGWAKDMITGVLAPTDLLYPGSHLMSVLLSEAAGIEVRRAMMLVSLVFRLLFVVFVPMGLYTLYGDRRIIFLGVVSALLLLPINHISTHDNFHTFTLAVFFTPFIYYLTFARVTGTYTDEALPDLLSPMALLLSIGSISIVFIHPQAAFNILLIFGTIVGVQALYRRQWPNHPISNFRSLKGHFILLAIIFLIWAGQFENMYRVIELMITSVQDTIAGTSEAGQNVRQRGQSSSSVGMSLTELFVKLFGVSLIYSILTGGLILSQFTDRLSGGVYDADGVILYFTYSGFVLIPFIGLHFLGDIDAYSFRHIGFAMAIATLLGTIALYQLSIDTSVLSVDLRPAVGAVALIALALSVLIVFSSPYIALPNSQVTEAETDGYATLFENQGDIPVLGIRTNGERFAEVHQYENEEVELGGAPNGTVFNERLVSAYDTDRYLAISEYDRQRDIEVYNGFRYSQKGFEQLNTTEGIHRVQTNGDLTVYYLT
jgi:hypothetical protein